MSDVEFVTGDTIGEYTVLQLCGAGAYGRVYLVRDASGRRFALKVLSHDRRGERELNGLLRFQRVSHPNLLHIDRLGTLSDGRIYYTMDAADNAADTEDAYEPDTLARRMRGGRVLPALELRRIMLELASGLAELHRAHLIHRDVKPDNILFVGGRAVLADAGAVDDAEGASLIGTPEYLPPEVRMGKRAPSAADDCHALGKVLYCALTGEPPRMFPGTPHTLISSEAVALFRVAERACTPPGLSVYEFRRLLEHPESLRPRHLPRRLLFVGAALCLIAAAGFAALLLFRKPKRPPVTPKTTVSHSQNANPSIPAAPPSTANSTAEQPAEALTVEELMKKYERTAEEQRLVDRWMEEYFGWSRRINRAGVSGDKRRVAELTAAMKKKLPYGIADFCGEEMRMLKLLNLLSHDHSPDKLRRLEAALRYRRDALKKLLERLPPEELAKWR